MNFFEINSDAEAYRSPWDAARLDGDIMIVERALTETDCKKIIERAEKHGTWGSAVTVGEQRAGKHDEDRRRISDLMPIGNMSAVNPEYFKPIDNVCYLAFNMAVAKYGELLEEPYHVSSDEGYAILRYSVGGKYTLHCDNGGEYGGTLRTLSALIYLNGDYEGGEIDFPRQKVRIKPSPGMLVMFPATANFRHASLPVTSGTKYTVVTWFK